MIASEKLRTVNHLTRRDFMRVSGLLAAGASLSACSASILEVPGTPQPAQLVYQDWRTEWFPPMAQAMLDEFHTNHPEIRVFYTPDPEDFVNQMAQDFRSGTASDVFQGCCTHFPSWAQDGYTLDLSPYIEADLGPDTILDWDSAQYAALRTSAGHQFGLPKYHGALGLFYNKDLFDKYGVDYPDGSWDIDDYLQAMELLADDTDGDGQVDRWGSAIDVSWDRIQVHTNLWGGHLVDPDDPARIAMAEKEAIEALSWLRERIIAERVMATPFHLQEQSLEDGFVKEKTAMIESGSWSLRTILNAANFRVGVAPFPRGPVRRVALSTTDGFGIYAGTRHPEAAWELLKFLISPEYGRAMARANLLQPARHSLVQDWVTYVHEAFPSKAKDIDLEAFAEGQAQGYSVTAEIFADMNVAQDLAYQAWDEILVLGEKPVDHIIEVSRQIQASQHEGG